MITYSSHRTNVLISEKVVGSVLAQVASALVYCHYGLRTTLEGPLTSNIPLNEWVPILHRDIKPANGDIKPPILNISH